MKGLEEASKLISMVTALDGKMNSLINQHNEEVANIDNLKKEMRRLTALTQQLEVTEKREKGLLTEIHEVKAERDDKVKVLTDGGWTFPMPPQPIIKSVSM